jgi:glutamate dehydrogenase (NAD(P)+)
VQDLQQLIREEEEVMRREYDNVRHRKAAMAIGEERVRAAKNTRGLFP